MRGSTHSRTARTAWLWCAPSVGAGLTLVGPTVDVMWQATLFGTGAVAATLTARLPDADTPNSSIRYSIPAGKTVTKGIGSIFAGHRGGTHSLVMSLVVGFAAAALAGLIAAVFAPGAAGDFSVAAGAGAAVGMFAHIAGGDLWTNRGIMLFWPFWRKRVSIPLMKTSPPRGPMRPGEWLVNLFLIVTQVYLVLEIPGVAEILESL